MQALLDHNIFVETVAGMIDEHTNVEQVAVKEYEEELGETVHGQQFEHKLSFYPSAGGSDEQVVLCFLPTQHHLDNKIIDTYKAKLQEGLQLHGALHEGERTAKVLIPTAWMHLFPDSKLMVAAGYYMRCAHADATN